MRIEFDDRNLVFVLSQQRAGSTLLQRILAGHPEIHTTAEPWLMLHPVYALRREGHQAEYNADLAFRALQGFLDSLEDGEERYVQAMREMALSLYGAACERASKRFFLDKTPRYYYIIPELARIFPGAKFIFLLRNPLAVLASILSTWVKGHWVLLARYCDDLLLAPKRLVEGIELLGERGIVVHYEDLVGEPETCIGSVCQHLGLQCQPEMIEYGLASTPEGEMGDPTGVDRHRRPTKDNLERWLELAREHQTRVFLEGYLHSLGPSLIAALGYNYTDLETRLEAVPCKEETAMYTWQQVIHPDEVLRRRMVAVELALLEHRRLVHTVKGWKKSLFG